MDREEIATDRGGQIMDDLDFFPKSIGRLNKQMQKIFGSELKSCDLSSAHAMYMMVLSENDGITLKELTESVGMDKANTTRVVRALKLKGYIYTDPATEGTRKYKVYLTEEGKKAAEIVRASITKMLDNIFSILTDSERAQYMLC
jgi:DNA-binding MarR family transcriptional regulator